MKSMFLCLYFFPFLLTCVSFLLCFTRLPFFEFFISSIVFLPLLKEKICKTKTANKSLDTVAIIGTVSTGQYYVHNGIKRRL
jgi:hypothetical protein